MIFPDFMNRELKHFLIFHRKITNYDNKSIGVLLTMFIGLLSISLGTLLMVFSPYDIIFPMKTTFSEGSEGFELWRKPPVEVLLKVYLYNITNKDEFLSGKEKLKVEQVGPYVYREIGEHADIEFNDNGTVSAVPKYPLEWVPELSVGTEEDKLMLPNVALLSFANVISKQSAITRWGVNLLISQTNSHPIVEQTAKEFMFGYESALVTLGNQFMPSWIKFDKLGLIDRMYDFNGDVETTYTGEKDLHLSGILATYNRSPTLPQWEAPCNKVEGSSDGTKFPTNIKPNETLWFFRKSMCRAVPMVPTGATTTHDGIPTARYRFKEDALDNGESNEENKCFCSNGQCLRNGLIDVTHCYYGFPIALSYPHFYMADPTLREEVDGCTPDPESHETYFYVNPQTGSPTKVSVKMQINIALQDVSSMLHCERFSNLVVPMLWTDITLQELSFQIKLKLFLLLRVLPVLETVGVYLLLIGGVSFIALSICALIFITDVKNQTQKKVQKPKKPSWNNNAVKKQEYKVDAEKSSQDVKNKEMDVYFCSLLSPNGEDNEDIKVPLTSSTD
ncbi:scavenger receptor class B member 1-like isoform X2 [Planococcus citri]|uniref:scavenger receptor class B member 1-like isoform X2 n=1 Tax=Planococcus citri TaxID=170843 RepID=UPI0031F934F6